MFAETSGHISEKIRIRQEEIRVFSDCGARLASERGKIGLASGKMAAACEVTADVQTDFEKGRRLPKGEYLLRAEALGVDILYVLTGRRQLALGADEDAQLLQRVINLWPSLPTGAHSALVALLESLTSKADQG